MSKEFNRLNLDRKNIIPSVHRFCGIYYDEYSISDNFEDRGGTRRRLNIKINDKEFFIDFHFNTTDATTSIEDFGGKEVSIKKELAKFIKESCLVSENSSNKWFVAKKIEKSDFEAILQIIEEESELYKETLIKEQCKDLFRYQCKSKYDEKVTVNYYNNGTVVVQGRPLLLFNEVATMFSELIDAEDIPKAFNDCYQIEIEKDNVISQYEIKMPNSHDKHEQKLKKVLLQAVYNTNIKGDMFDYSYLTSPALRALEGHIKYVYKYNSIIIGNNSIGGIFDKINTRFYLKQTYKANLNDANKIKYIEDAYNYYYANRHTLSHWNDVEQPQDDTRIIENYGEAIRIIDDTLSIIDSYYKL